MNNKTSCVVCEELESGDTLYKYSGWEHGMNFDSIMDIKYCPFCGNKLLTYKEKYHKLVKSGNSENE